MNWGLPKLLPSGKEETRKVKRKASLPIEIVEIKGVSWV